MEKMPISIANDAQRIVDEVTAAQKDMEMITNQDAWLLSLASLIRDLAREVSDKNNNQS